MAIDRRALDRLAVQQERERRRQQLAMQERLGVVLANRFGFERLLAITDEEWQAATLAGESVEVQ